MVWRIGAIVLAIATAVGIGCRTSDPSRPSGPSAASLPAVAAVPETEPVIGKPIEHPLPEPPPVGPPAPSELRLHALFAHHMVLQQRATVPVWGWARDGEMVSVQFRNQTVSALSRNGRWRIHLRDLEPGGPESLVISASDRRIVLTNVLVGEVWLCSGQSNMEWPLKKAYQPQADIAAATNTSIRFFVVPNTKADAPESNVNGAWEVCSPESAANFSAVGYYFGRDLQAARGVPVGLIQADWGGSPAEAWTSAETLAENPRYRAEILDTYPAQLEQYQTLLAAHEKEKEEAQQKKREFKKPVPRPPWKPTELYNGMIAPLVPYAFQGVIWYQGESNAARAHQYRSLFTDLIRDWRRQWGRTFPFLCVQLAPFKPIRPQPGESDWAELREAQWLATQTLPQVGMAVITDVGDEQDIHPTKKAPVGQRLALAARAIAYGEQITAFGPVYRSMHVQQNRILLTFDHVGDGLEIRGGGALKGFSICGADRQFYWALAQIQPDNTIAVWSPNVPEPVAVRFGWADFPVVNLWNRNGLPASPFRTDDFPLSTDPATRTAQARNR